MYDIYDIYDIYIYVPCINVIAKKKSRQVGYHILITNEKKKAI